MSYFSLVDFLFVGVVFSILMVVGYLILKMSAIRRKPLRSDPVSTVRAGDLTLPVVVGPYSDS